MLKAKNPIGKIEFFKKRIERQKEKRDVIQSRRRKLREYIGRAGLNIQSESLSRRLFRLGILINLIISAYLIYKFSTSYGVTWSTIAASLVVLWILIFILVIFFLWVAFYISIDMKTYKRKLEIEDVLPDFLQLTASNIKAGMTIDKALWYAVRPRFGVLAKEIETVAKETMSGVDLKESLRKFASKYDSSVLKKSINMLIESIDAGGEIGDLLIKIANNIQEQKIAMKEMSASVTTYVIFISFASIVAAPILFALSSSLISIIQKLGTTLGSLGSTAATTGMPLSFSGTGVSTSDFKIFAIVSLTISSSLSAMMVSTIKKGNIKSGLKYVPIFIITSIVIYLFADKIVGSLLGLVF